MMMDKEMMGMINGMENLNEMMADLFAAMTEMLGKTLKKPLECCYQLSIHEWTIQIAIAFARCHASHVQRFIKECR